MGTYAKAFDTLRAVAANMQLLNLHLPSEHTKGLHMRVSEKRAITMLAMCLATFIGTTVSPMFTSNGEAMAVNSKADGFTMSAVSYTTCKPTLMADIEDIDADYNVTDLDTLAALNTSDALNWQADYMDSFADYALCVGQSTPGATLPVDEGKLISDDYTRLAYVGVMLYLLSDTEALTKLGFEVGPDLGTTASSSGRFGFTERSTATETNTTSSKTKRSSPKRATSLEIDTGGDDDSPTGEEPEDPFHAFIKCIAELFGAVSIYQILNKFADAGIPNPAACMRMEWCRKKILDILKKWAKRLTGPWGTLLLVLEIGTCAYKHLEWDDLG